MTPSLPSIFILCYNIFLNIAFFLQFPKFQVPWQQQPVPRHHLAESQLIRIWQHEKFYTYILTSSVPNLWYFYYTHVYKTRGYKLLPCDRQNTLLNSLIITVAVRGWNIPFLMYSLWGKHANGIVLMVFVVG
jgi:hypothetical protein